LPESGEAVKASIPTLLDTTCSLYTKFASASRLTEMPFHFDMLEVFLLLGEHPLQTLHAAKVYGSTYMLMGNTQIL
jgi:hypothetical protein